MREPVKFGDYYLFERVAVGGMAEVFKAVSYGVEGFERLFALKRVLPNISEDQEFIEMFIDEAKIAVQLTHANIGQIFELGKVDSAYFIAMEFVQGKDTRALFDRARKRHQGLDIPMCCHIVKEVCEALEYAHAKRNEHQESLGLVHRDVSPQNVLVSYDGEVKLIDFGIAKAAGKASKTQAGILKGKFGYMSPEQVRGKPIDRRSDLFSLAVVLYELLTLERCFQGESDFSTLEKVRSVDIRRPASINRDIPPELERIVLKGLSRSPNDRYQSAAEFQEALQKFLYQSGAFYSRKDLAAYMRRTFSREFEDEQNRLAAFRALARQTIPESIRAGESTAPTPTPSGSSFKPDLPSLNWQPEEAETAVWDRSPSQVLAAVDLERSVAGPNTDPPAFANASRARASTAPARPASVGLASDAAVLPNPAPTPTGSGSRLVVLALVALLAAVGGVFAVRHFAPRFGQLTIHATPAEQVEVHLDGAEIFKGPTPFTVKDVRRGRHELVVIADGYVEIRQWIEVTDGEEKDLRVKLRKAQTPTGFVIDTKPGGATIAIDGKALDQSPATVRGFEPGLRNIRITKEGYLPFSGQVLATEGSLTEVQLIELFPETIGATFIAEPDVAQISLRLADGKLIPLGTGSVSWNTVENQGRVSVIAEAPGYERLELLLEQSKERQIRRHLKLVKRPETPTPKPRWRGRKTPKPPKTATPGACVGEDCPSSADTVKTQPREPVAKPAPKKTKKKKKKIAKFGFLSLLAKPPARAFVGGKDLGWTPLVKHRLKAGTHRVTLVREQAPAYRKEVSVQIKASELTFFRYP